jgi:hypothetical protein
MSGKLDVYPGFPPIHTNDYGFPLVHTNDSGSYIIEYPSPRTSPYNNLDWKGYRLYFSSRTGIVQEEVVNE